jgi:hypothetical protein
VAFLPFEPHIAMSAPIDAAAGEAADVSDPSATGGGGGKRSHGGGGGGSSSSEDHWSVVLKKLAPQGYQKSPQWQQEIIERVVKQMTKRSKDKRMPGLSKEALARTIDLKALGVGPEAAEAFKAEEQRVAKAMRDLPGARSATSSWARALQRGLQPPCQPVDARRFPLCPTPRGDPLDALSSRLSCGLHIRKRARAPCTPRGNATTVRTHVTHRRAHTSRSPRSFRARLSSPPHSSPLLSSPLLSSLPSARRPRGDGE